MLFLTKLYFIPKKEGKKERKKEGQTERQKECHLKFNFKKTTTRKDLAFCRQKIS